MVLDRFRLPYSCKDPLLSCSLALLLESSQLVVDESRSHFVASRRRAQSRPPGMQAARQDPGLARAASGDAPLV